MLSSPTAASFAEYVALAHRASKALDHINHIIARTNGLRPKPHPDTYLRAGQARLAC